MDANLKFIVRAYVEAEKRIDEGTADRLDRELVESMKDWPTPLFNAAVKGMRDGE